MAWYGYLGLALALLALALVALVVQRGRRYRAIFAPAHFRELASALKELKPELESVAETARPSSLLTSAGVGVVYTVSPAEDGTQHHLSLSYRGGFLARAAGLAIVGFLVELMGIDIRRVHPFATQTGVLHAVFKLSPEEQAAWRGYAVVAPEGEELDQRVARSLSAREVLLARLAQVEVPLPS